MPTRANPYRSPRIYAPDLSQDARRQRMYDKGRFRAEVRGALHISEDLYLTLLTKQHRRQK